MKISYKAAASGGIWSVLADIASNPPEFISGFAPGMQSTSQVEEIFGATHKKVFDRGNAIWSLTFVVARQHADTATAMAFPAQHTASLAGELDLKIEEGGETTYLLNCSLVSFQPLTEIDISSTFRYNFIGERYAADTLGSPMIGEGGAGPTMGIEGGGTMVTESQPIP